MKPLISILLVAVVGCGVLMITGCKPQGADGNMAFDAQSSAAYRAAWEKRRSGDVEGARAMMKEVANKYPNSRAGHRAKDESEPPTKQMVSFTRLVTALSKQVSAKPDAQ